MGTTIRISSKKHRPLLRKQVLKIFFKMKFVLIAFALTVLLSCSKVSGKNVEADSNVLEELREFYAGAEQPIADLETRDDQCSPNECGWCPVTNPCWKGCCIN